MRGVISTVRYEGGLVHKKCLFSFIVHVQRTIVSTGQMAFKHAGTLVCHNILQNVMDLTSMVYEGAVDMSDLPRQTLSDLSAAGAVRSLCAVFEAVDVLVGVCAEKQWHY